MKQELLPIKSFQETLHQSMCGPASLKMVFDYYGIEKTGIKIAEMCGTDEKLGTNDKTIKKVAEELGFKVETKNNSSFEDVEEWIERGVPVIVNWFTRGRADYCDTKIG